LMLFEGIGILHASDILLFELFPFKI